MLAAGVSSASAWATEIVGVRGDGFGHEVGVPEAGRAAPPVERVGADLGVADRMDAERQRLAVDHHVPPAVHEPGHHVDLGDRLGRSRQPLDGGAATGGGVERGRLGEAPQLVIGDGDGQRDRERPVVAREHAVLEVAEVAADRGALGRAQASSPQPVEAREVDDAGVVDLLGHVGGAQPPSQAGSALRRPVATTLSAAGSSPPSSSRTPVTAGAPEPLGRGGQQSLEPLRRSRSTWPSASTARRSTHSNVVRRQHSITRSSSPGSGAKPTIVGGRC